MIGSVATKMLRKVVEDILPPDLKYVITGFSIIESSQFLNETKFSAKFSAIICLEYKVWINMYLSLLDKIP